MATIVLGAFNYDGYSSNVTLTYTESAVNIASNTSTIHCVVASSGNRTRNNVTQAFTVMVDGQSWVAVSTGSKTSHFSVTHDFTVSHNNDGTKKISISFSGNITIDSGSPKRSGSAEFTLTNIPRNNAFSISPLLLTSGQTATITADRHGTNYTSTITWSNGINSGTITSGSTATSWQVSYSTLSAGIPNGTSRAVTFTCKTYNGSTQVGDTITLSLTINTGKIPASMYDDKNGNVGVTIGERATGPGFNLKVKAGASDLLWDNPSAYTAGTKMGAGSINLGNGWQDKYSFLLIGFTYAGEWPSTGTLLIPVVKNSVAQWHAESSRSTTYIRVRYFSLTSTGVNYSIGYAFDHYNGKQYSGEDAQGNISCLPAFVIGIR